MEDNNTFDIDKVDLKKQGPKSLKKIIEHYDQQYGKDMGDAAGMINNMMQEFYEKSQGEEYKLKQFTMFKECLESVQTFTE